MRSLLVMYVSPFYHFHTSTFSRTKLFPMFLFSWRKENMYVFTRNCPVNVESTRNEGGKHSMNILSYCNPMKILIPLHIIILFHAHHPTH